ncbi:hypothetical protein [Yinghuangia soli]|uniref:Uncharacterized protein n=1 Tax=Yinghuangia soli TaxID=2908204 RepID=A0AA41PWA6_9ACTN|nr:hypothetical protein [Yinghuangia soli]MCF2527063.1 hypothetical protein [Yinghuangia soli]
MDLRSTHRDQDENCACRWCEMVAEARSVWEGNHDHDEFRRYLRSRDWHGVQAIKVIYRVHGIRLKDAVDRYDEYARQNAAETAET